jgi:hypothetical protein
MEEEYCSEYDSEESEKPVAKTTQIIPAKTAPKMESEEEYYSEEDASQVRKIAENSVKPPLNSLEVTIT